MKRDEFSLVEVFEDPLMTIVALVLLSTLWMIFPSESKPVNPEVYYNLDEIDILKKEIESMAGKITQLKLEEQQRSEEVKWLEGVKETTRVDDKRNQKNTEEMGQEIVGMENLIKEKREELKQLEDKLKIAQEDLNKAEGEGDTEGILANIKKLNEDIERMKKELSLVEGRIIQAKKDLEKEKERKNSQEDLTAQLQNRLKATQDETKKLEAERKGTVSDAVSGGGFKPIFESDRIPLYIELANNQLFPVDEDHYDVNYGYLKIEDGSMVQATKKSRKSQTHGESIEEIERTQSNFYKVLNKLDSKKERIIFLLHSDSFQIFKKARELALKKGIEIGWWPYEDEYLILVSDGGEGIGSTDRPEVR